MALILEINGTFYPLPAVSRDAQGLGDSMRKRLASQAIDDVQLEGGKVTVDWSNVATVRVFEE